MKKVLSLVMIMVLCLTVPLSAFASEGEGENVPTELHSEFLLVEKDADIDFNDKESLKALFNSEKTAENGIQAQAAPPVGGMGDIFCKAIGGGKMSCDWSITLTKKGEAIQSMYLIFEVSNSSGNIVGTKEVYKTPLGGNKATYKDQIDFNPGKGMFNVEKYGAVEGRTAVYEVVAVTGDWVNVY
ncbi:hypothetical protein OIN60_20035 [Paenibacillus sp. P96]|uniref:Uncharacterized protein n=1 Tax=Paenibacillus zeirhizosphaerae TaxID=2987519 RepID=A0ABT9FWA9_9BACL|nr:hypothetical protein [Paenibacillus sp. P96]MDP4099019.1 hypothetical protein [Paenibacillus sp. P96]